MYHWYVAIKNIKINEKKAPIGEMSEKNLLEALKIFDAIDKSHTDYYYTQHYKD